MKSFIEQMHFYANYHRNKETFYSHLVGIPLIILSSMIFLGFFHIVSPNFFDISLAEVACLVILIYYIWLNWRLGLMLVPVFLILLWLSNIISYNGITGFSVWFFIIIFALGWAAQLFGHYREGTKPAIMDSVRQAFVAPLFLMAELCFRMGIMTDLRTQLHGEEVVIEPVVVEKKPTNSKRDNEL